jgi:hypothetical protein
MERYRNQFFIMVIGLLLLSTWGCTSMNVSTASIQSDRVDYEVSLRPDLGQDLLVPTSPPQGWESSGEDDGYVGFEPDTYGDVIFVLEGEELGKTRCTNDVATSANWVITSIEITRFKHPQKKKGDKFGKSQRKSWWNKGWLLKAYPNASEEGVFFRKSKNQGIIYAAITNENNNDAKKPELGWYQVEATRCSDGHTVKTDPGVRNGGKK